VLPVILRIVITTTLMSLSTASPYTWIFIKINTSEAITTMASNALKKSARNTIDEAKDFSMISMKKNVKKAKSI